MHRLFSTPRFVVSLSEKQFKVFVRTAKGLEEVDPASLDGEAWKEIQEAVKSSYELVELYPVLMAWKFGVRRGCAKKGNKCVKRYLEYIRRIEEEERRERLSELIPPGWPNPFS